MRHSVQHRYFPTCVVRGQEWEKKGKLGKRTTTHSYSKDMSTLLLQSLYLNERGFISFEPSTSLNNIPIVNSSFCAYKLSMLSKTWSHCNSYSDGYRQWVSRKQQMAFILILARFWPYERFVSRLGKHCPDAVIIGCMQNCLKLYLKFSYQPAGMTFQMGSHWDLGSGNNFLHYFC